MKQAHDRALRVLVVDDDHVGAEIVSEFLRTLGCDVCMANSGKTALEIAPRYRPAAVILDIEMPGLNGAETARRLKKDRRFRRTIFIAHTAASAMKNLAVRSGFHYFVAKGNSVGALQRIIKSLQSGGNKARLTFARLLPGD